MRHPDGLVPLDTDKEISLCSEGYSTEALTEIDQFFRKTEVVIVPLTVQEILDEQLARKLA